MEEEVEAEVEAKKMDEGTGEERGGCGGGWEWIHQEMCAALHRCIGMVIKMASKPSVFFSLSTRNYNNMLPFLS